MRKFGGKLYSVFADLDRLLFKLKPSSSIDLPILAQNRFRVGPQIVKLSMIHINLTIRVFEHVLSSELQTHFQVVTLSLIYIKL